MSAKQEKAIQQRLNDLGKENHRDINIPVPKREGARGKDRKTTQNARRILAYSRTFQHYLADEEAGVNVYGSAGNIASTAPGAQIGAGQAQKLVDSRRKGATPVESTSRSKAAVPRWTGSLKKASTPSRSTPVPVKQEKDTTKRGDVEMTDVAAEPNAPASPSTSPKSPRQTRRPSSSSHKSPTTLSPAAPYDPALDRDPLLRTRDLPKMPSERVMQALVAEPPLSYNAARAKPLDRPASTSMHTGSSAGLAKPQRWFCAMCGYWGKLRCKRGCGERVCGLMECWRAHEGVCALAAY